jgi:uncharacterized Ntn-hydrolase superfamily protein
MTFSIVGADAATGDVGVAVASKFLSVGAVVPFARAGAGAVATQSFADVTFGPRGLDALGAGASPGDVLEQLLAGDSDRELRQVGVIDTAGVAATFTGSGCMEWAGGRIGEGYAAQGNILSSAAVVTAMVSAYEATMGEPLANRLLAALTAGDREGGDRRGRQSAALLVARPNGGYGGNHDRYMDLRVDDHQSPVAEVARLLDLHHLYFDHPAKDDIVSVDPNLRAELESVLARTGRSGEPDSFGDRLYALIATENLEERWVSADRMDRRVIDFLRQLSS